MNCFTVSLFGHREVEDLRNIEAKLSKILKDLLQTNEYVSFLIGRNGEFDEFAASVIKSEQKKFGKEKSELILILPYPVAKQKYYEKYYDSITIPESIYSAYPKSAIALRNRWMIEHSDLVIFHLNHTSGGTHTAKKYAEKLGKSLIII